MREILFRGKSPIENRWIEGLLVQVGKDYSVIRKLGKDGKGYYDYIVYPYTVSQFTGLTDKNGKKIFEGDIVKVTGLYPDRDGEQRIWRQFRVGEVFYYHGAFFFGKWELQKTSEKCIEIIGNIHDNPELLEEEEE